jgi:hypothetical protein
MLHLSMLTPGRLRIALAIVLGLAFAGLQFTTKVAEPPPSLAWQHDGRLHVFFHPGNDGQESAGSRGR